MLLGMCVKFRNNFPCFFFSIIRRDSIRIWSIFCRILNAKLAFVRKFTINLLVSNGVTSKIFIHRKSVKSEIKNQLQRFDEWVLYRSCAYSTHRRTLNSVNSVFVSNNIDENAIIKLSIISLDIRWRKTTTTTTPSWVSTPTTSRPRKKNVHRRYWTKMLCKNATRLTKRHKKKCTR